MATAQTTERGPVTGDHEWELVRRAQEGDVAAFEELYRASVGRIHALCLRMGGDPHLAEELVQESYLRAWRRLGSYRGESAFGTWLHRVTINVVLGHLRRPSWRRETSLEGIGDPPVPPISAARTLDLERAVAALPTRARTVFVLHDVEGYRHDEIARLAGMAVGTSKSQLSRARRLLRKALTR